MKTHYLKWYTRVPDRTLFDLSASSLQSLFPLPTDGVIQRNRCYLNDEVYRYLYMPCVTVKNALTSVFDGGVYFLWDCRREWTNGLHRKSPCWYKTTREILCHLAGNKTTRPI